MLFKKFGPWGGVIEKNHKEFVQSLSSLVESKLVNDETLREAWTSGEFKTALEEWMRDVIKDELSKKSMDMFIDFINVHRTELENIINIAISKELASGGIIGGFVKNIMSANNFAAELCIVDKICEELLKNKNMFAGQNKISAAARSLSGFIKENSGGFLNGRVSAAVTKELSKLDAAEASGMARDFMGREMKGITIFGAALGLIAGIITAFVSQALRTTSKFSPVMLLIYAVVFAAVGIGTNYIAIKMLFRPHKPVFRSAKHPPFIGLAVSRKKEFAEKTGGFVRDKLLTPNVCAGVLADFFDGAHNSTLQKNMPRIIDFISAEISNQKKHITSRILDSMPWWAAPFNSNVESVVEYIIDKDIPVFLRNKTDELYTILYFIVKNYLFPSIIDSAPLHFPRVLNAIDVRAVVEREINAMEPSEIENMFYDFAGMYFRKITLYGWIGGAGGLAGYTLSII